MLRSCIRTPLSIYPREMKICKGRLYKNAYRSFIHNSPVLETARLFAKGERM